MTTAAAGTVIMAVIETGTGTVAATTATEIATETTALAMIAPHLSTSFHLTGRRRTSCDRRLSFSVATRATRQRPVSDFAR